MYSLVAQILKPYTLFLLALAGAALWAWWSKNLRRRALLLACSLLGLLFCLSTPLAGFLALRSLEGPDLPAAVVPLPRDTIVVLSGSMQRDDDAGTQLRPGPDTYGRCHHAVHLYKRAGGCRLLLSGGRVDFPEPSPTLAQVMRDFVIELGVQPGDIVLEEQSSTTLENATFSKGFVQDPKEARVFLVTDAAHMPRSVYCFQTQGVGVIPAPCNYQARRMQFSAKTLLPSVEGINAVSYAAHEWLGLAWYHLRFLGKT